MFLGAVLGAEDVQPPGLGYFQRDLGMDHGCQRGQVRGHRLRRADPGQAVIARDRRAVRDRHD
jgi:hypothetical protein